MAAAAQFEEAPSADAATGGDAVYDNVASALHLASTAGQLEVVLTLLETGARPDGGAWSKLTSAEVEGNSGDWHYWRGRVCGCDPTPLHEAAGRGHVDIVGALLAAGARRNPRASMANCHSPCIHQRKILTHEPGGHTPLHVAALYGHAAVVNVLVEAGANVDILGGKRAETPLHLATRHGHTAAMLALLHKWADVDAVNNHNQTALHEATSVATMKLLLMAGADKNGRATRLTETPLGLLVSTTGVRLTSDSELDEATALVGVLLRHGANASVPAGQQDQQENLYYTRTAANDRSTSRATTPDSSPGHARSPVFFSSAATGDWSPDTSSDKLKGGYLGPDGCRRQRAQDHVSPASESTQSFWSPKFTWVGPPSSSASLLPCAAKNGVPGVVAALLSTGLDPTEPDEHSKTPLHYAAQEGHSEILRLLLQAGAEVDCANHTERTTPLHLACRCAHLDCVLELLRWGASLDALCVLSDHEFGVDYGGDRHRAPLQMVGCADLRTDLHLRERCSRKYEDGEIEEEHCGCAGEQETGVAATRNAIRRALLHEGRWRRRGGVIILLALLNKINPKDVVPTQKVATTAAAPASRPCYSSSGDTDIINLANYFENAGDCAGAGCCGHDAKRACPVTSYGSGNRESISGDEAGSGGCSVPICDMLEEEEDSGGETDDNSMCALLAGLMDLRWGNETLFRKIVRYL